MEGFIKWITGLKKDIKLLCLFRNCCRISEITGTNSLQNWIDYKQPLIKAK